MNKIGFQVLRAVLFFSAVALMNGVTLAGSGDAGKSFAIKDYTSVEVYNPLAYGAVGDARICANDASIYAGDSVLTSPSAGFTGADVGLN